MFKLSFSSSSCSPLYTESGEVYIDSSCNILPLVSHLFHNRILSQSTLRGCSLRNPAFLGRSGLAPKSTRICGPTYSRDDPLDPYIRHSLVSRAGNALPSTTFIKYRIGHIIQSQQYSPSCPKHSPQHHALSSSKIAPPPHPQPPLPHRNAPSTRYHAKSTIPDPSTHRLTTGTLPPTRMTPNRARATSAAVDYVAGKS
jgi:hypothetical protein